MNKILFVFLLFLLTAITGAIIGYSLGTVYEHNRIESMLYTASGTTNLIKADNYYYEIIKYEYVECSYNDGNCVLTILPDLDKGYYLFNMTTGGSQYKDGYYKGLHEGNEMGWDTAYTRIKSGCK